MSHFRMHALGLLLAGPEHPEIMMQPPPMYAPQYHTMPSGILDKRPEWLVDYQYPRRQPGMGAMGDGESLMDRRPAPARSPKVFTY